MTDEDAWRDALWKVYQDNHTYVRHHEVQRSTVATLIMAIASAALAVATFDQSLTSVDTPLLVLVLVLGVFGIAFSFKQYERTCMHIDRADALVTAAESTLGGRSVLQITSRADAEHKSRFPVFFRLGVSLMWMVLYLFLALVALTSIFIAQLYPIASG